MRRAALAFIGVSFVLAIVVWQSSEHLPWGESPDRVHTKVLDPVLSPWLRWDSSAYADLADHGYTKADVATFHAGGEARVAHFPGYPLAVRTLALATRDTPLALVVTTFLSGLALAIVFARWCRELLNERATRYATGALLLFPWAFFFVATGYGDGLYALLAVAAFSLLERDRPLAAGVVGALAALTRVIGVGLLIGLVVRAAERRGSYRLSRRDIGVLLTGLGLLAFMAFCWRRYGDPLAFNTAQRGWGSPPGLRTWLKFPLWNQVRHDPDRQFVVRLLLQGAVGIAFCAAVPTVRRKLGVGYAAYTFFALAIPMLGSADFSSMGRQVMAAFPVFAVIGERLSRGDARQARVVLAASGAVLVLFASLWGRGYLVA